MPDRKSFNGFLPQKYAGLGIQLIPSVIFGLSPKSQPFLQKMADFSKICLNAVRYTVLTNLEPQYITFIQKINFELKNHFFGYFWLIFGWIWLIFKILQEPRRVPYAMSIIEIFPLKVERRYIWHYKMCFHMIFDMVLLTGFAIF